MDITLLSLKVVLFFFPGILAFGVFSAYTYKQKRQLFETLLNIFAFGVLAYVLYDVVNWVLSCESRSENGRLLGFILEEKMPTFQEVILVSFAGILVGIVASVMFNRKVLHRIGKKLRFTNRFAEPDVWAYLHEADEIQWVSIRDFEFNLTYHGWVAAYGDTSENPEILLREVRVCERTSGKFLYEMDAIYIARPLTMISIEVQKFSNENK